MMKNKPLYGIIAIYAVIAVMMLIFFNGTGDAGDSILHYLYAKYAPSHLELYFDHWAKPLYVLFASPFAQFGFIGVKVFNVIVFGGTIVFTYHIANLLRLENPVVSFILLICSPLYFILTFSGLTEPLFALFLSMGIYFFLKNKYITACLIISFLPFIRSEGLVLIGIVGLFLLIKKEWELLPLLFVGHLAYAAAGSFVYDDLLWVFTRIPYNNLGSPYGSGELFHFVEKLIYVIGVPVYILFWTGFLSIIWKSFKKSVDLEIQILFLAGFIAFLTAHSLFWYLGIFNSMGLGRVFVAISPITSVIALIGFNLITEEWLKNKRIARISVQSLLIGYVLIFPLTSNPAAIHPKKDLELWAEQEVAIQIADYLQKENKNSHRMMYSHPYLSEVLHIDHFDSKKHLELDKVFLKELHSGDIIIWENWFAIVEHNVTKEYLDEQPDLLQIHQVTVLDDKTGREIIFAVYQKK